MHCSPGWQRHAPSPRLRPSMPRSLYILTQCANDQIAKKCVNRPAIMSTLPVPFCSCVLYDSTYVRTCVFVWHACPWFCEREIEIKTPPAFSLNKLLAVNSKSTLLWSLKGVVHYRDESWTVLVATWKESRKKLCLSLRAKEWKERGALFANFSKRGVCMN